MHFSIALGEEMSWIPLGSECCCTKVVEIPAWFFGCFLVATLVFFSSLFLLLLSSRESRHDMWNDRISAIVMPTLALIVATLLGGVLALVSAVVSWVVS